jgi:hypothetical protein
MDQTSSESSSTTGNQTGAGQSTQQTQDQAPGWVAALPDELKSNEVLRKFAKPGDFAKEALSWKERAERGVIRPTDKSTADELAAYRKAMGIPESSDKYEFPEEIDGVKMSPERISAFRELAHKVGLSTEAALALVQMDAAQVKASDEAREAERAKAIAFAEATFQEEWGQDFARNKELAIRGLNSLPEKVATKLRESGMADDPDIVRYLMGVGANATEDTFRDGKQSNSVPKTLAERLYGK